MEESRLKKCALFTGIPETELAEVLAQVPHQVRRYDRGETIFRFMEEADRVGILLAGSVEAVKPFPNGSQVNVSLREAGDMIGHAAAFAAEAKYPCAIEAVTSADIMIFRREDLLALLHRDIRILENYIREIATATYMLQEKLELLSYSGIGQKAAYFLLLRANKTGSRRVRIPKSISNWAEMMNVSRPSLHRELRKMETEGMISYQSPYIEILDPDCLRRILSL